jgi:hypothetical protein
VTPLNFVCKCRAAPPPRKRPTVSREIRIEQTFGRARTCAIFCSRGRNADELRVFVAQRRLLFCAVGAFARAASTRFRSREGARRNGFTKPKFFCGEPPEKALWRAFRGAKRTNRSNRFASPAPPEAAFDAMRHPRAGDFRDASSERVPRAAKFPHARAPTKPALRCRDAS